MDRNNPGAGCWPFYRDALLIAMPIMLQQLIAMTMGFTDSVMVGQLDAASMAGVTVANKYFVLVSAVLFGLTGGIGIFISQYFGAGDQKKGQAMFMLNHLGAILVAGLFALTIGLFPRQIYSLFVADPGTVANGLDYMRFVRFSYIPYAINLVFQFSFRGIGHTRLPLLVGSAAILLNTLLNYLLIFGHLGLPAMGTGGAGLATLIARLFETAVYIAALAGGKAYFTLSLQTLRSLSRQILRKVALKILPLMSMELLWSLGMTVLFWSYCQVDETVVASLAIVETIANFNFVIYGGLGVAVSVLVGARLGAGSFDEARANARRIMRLGFAISAAYGLIVIGLAGWIPRLFQVSEEIRAMAGQMLRIQGGVYGFIALNVMIFYTLRIGGDVRATLLMESAFVWLAVIPLSLVFSQVIRPEMYLFFLAIQAAEIVKSLIGRHFIRQGRWIANLT